MASLLSIFIPQKCVINGVSRTCTFSDNFADLTHYNTFVVIFNFITLGVFVGLYYVEIKSKKSKMNVDILQHQVDSIRAELNSAITGVAAASDNVFNLNSAMNVKRTPSARRQVDVQANTAILTQLLGNLELAKVTLRKETPLIQIIDRPIFPLEKEKVGKLKSLVLVGFLAGFLTVLYLVFTALYKKMIA